MCRTNEDRIPVYYDREVFIILSVKFVAALDILDELVRAFKLSQCVALVSPAVPRSSFLGGT